MSVRYRFGDLSFARDRGTVLAIRGCCPFGKPFETFALSRLPLPSVPNYNAVVIQPSVGVDDKQMNVGRTQTKLLILTALSMTVTAISAATITHAVPIDPKVAALVKKADAAFNLKQYDLAIRTYSDALQMKPETITAAAIYSWRAGAYGKKGEFGNGMSDASEAIRLNPKYFNGYNERGIIYRRTGNPDQAISRALCD